MRKRNPALHPVLRMILVCLALIWPVSSLAEDRQFRLSVPTSLLDSGLMDYLLPRFSLKTGVRIEIVPDGTEAEMALGPGEGRAVFQGEDTLWRMRLTGDHPGAARFADWLTSDIGQRTVTSYEVGGRAPFSLPEIAEEVVASTVFDGDAAEGKRVSLLHCGRCHVVAPENRMGTIGSTPSFAVLRTLPDWGARFQSFYALKPHPAFTQITGITSPFPPNLPSPIVPIEVTPEELEAILAYVARIDPADLGAPIQVQ